MQKKSVPSTDKNDRRRGRPAGKNRTPLSIEERRARNAQYERERRNETADAMTQLAEAACCEPDIGNAELLATVISQLQRRAKKELPQDIEDLKRANENLESQIAELQSRLGHNNVDELNDLIECDWEPRSETLSDTRDQIRATKVRRSRKIRKTSKSSSVHMKSPSESNSDSSDSSSESSWSEIQETAPTKYKLRARRQMSEQSECTVSTYQRSESESSQSSPEQELSECSNKSEISSESLIETNGPTSYFEVKVIKEEYQCPLETTLVGPQTHIDGQHNDPFLPAITELKEEKSDYEDQSETLTDAETKTHNEWLDCSNVLDLSGHQDNNRVHKFLDFDDFVTGF